MHIADIWDRHPRDRKHHPHAAFLLLDQLDFCRLEVFCEDNRDVLIFNVERDVGGGVRVTCGCTTAEIKARLEDAWG